MKNCVLFLENDFNDFYIRNLWWIIALGVILIGGLLILLMRIRYKSKGKSTPKVSIEDNLEAIGGKDNVIAHSLNGSRIVLVLRDYEAIDREKLKNAGAVGFVLKSDKITIVFKNDAKKVYKEMFGE